MNKPCALLKLVKLITSGFNCHVMRKKIDSRMKGKKDKKKIYDGTFQTVKLESFGKSSVSKITDKETRLNCLK